MKKKLAYILAFLSLLTLLTACEKGGDVEYMQKVLKEPEVIEVFTGSAVVTYEKGSDEYQKIWDTLSPNWWLTAKDTPDTAPSDALSLADGPASLKTTTNRTYVASDDTIVKFLYEEAPVQWYQEDGSKLDIQLIAFLLPPAADSADNVKGCFTVSQTDSIGVNEGQFTYYYPAEVAAGFWNFLVH